MSLKDRVALVTGGGSGIGLATVKLLAENGVHLVIGNRNVELGEAAAAEAKKLGVEAVFQKTDVTQPADVESLVQLAVKKFGRLGLAVNNAGVEGPSVPLHEHPIDVARHIMDVNVHGVFLAMKYEIPLMQRAGGGSIVNTSSILGVKAVPNFSIYNASKHAVIGLTRSAALEYAADKIRINAVAPGPIETPMLNNITGGNPHEFGNLTPMRRIGTPEEIAAGIVWLLSESSSFMTGGILNIDGGMVAS